MHNEENPKSSGDEEILKIAHERFRLASEAEIEIRTESLDDLRFSVGDQWPAEVKASREQDRRPCLTINRLPQFIRQITNDQRQNRPSPKVSPVDDNADIETAKIYQGMLRHIEHASDAENAYDTAFDSAVRCGFGYFRIVTEFADPMSFEQEIRIKRIRNRFSVYLDPSYQQPDGSDANWGFVFEDLNEDDFKAQYPNAKMSSMADWSSIGDKSNGWSSQKQCRVAEYFYKEYKDATIVQLSDGSTHEESGLPPFLPEGVVVVAKRDTQIPIIKWCKINGVEVLEKTEWPGRWIPIIPVLGDEIDIDGRKILEGVIRHAKDPQRMLNYWKSSETETIALAPRAPWIGAEGQFEGFENNWKTANIKNHAYLEYKTKTLNGTPVGPPQRNVFEPPVQAITNASQYAADDLKGTTGIYDAGLGNRSNENSGVAIQRRAAQGQTSNFHFIDNLSKSIRHGARICMDLIPHIYDTARATRILGEDGTEEVVRINQEFEKDGKMVAYHMGVGKYDVSISTGPSFESKRQEAVQAMLDFTRSMPQQAGMIADLLVKNMDWPGAQEIAERLRKTLPPGMADEKGKKQPLPPEAQQQMTQMNQIIEQLTEKLNEAQDKADNKILELESKERIEMAKLQVQLEIKMAEMGSAESLALLRAEIAQIESRMAQLNAFEPIAHEESESQQYESFEAEAGPYGSAPPIEDQQPPGGFAPGSTMEMP